VPFGRHRLAEGDAWCHCGLAVEEAGKQSAVGYEDMKSTIDSLLICEKISGISYDYSLSVDVIPKDLADLLYLEYQEVSVLSRVFRNIESDSILYFSPFPVGHTCHAPSD